MKPKTYLLSTLLLAICSISYAMPQGHHAVEHFNQMPDEFKRKIDSVSRLDLTRDAAEVLDITNELFSEYLILHTDHLKLQRHMDRVIYSNRMTEMELRDVVFKSGTPNEESGWWLYFFWLNVLALSGLYFIVLFKRKQKIPAVKVKKKNGNHVKFSDFRLTGREVDVLTLMCKFKSNPEISKSLFISMNTTKTHVSNILGKLEVSNRKEAIHKVRRLNLLEKLNSPESKEKTKEQSSVLSIFILGLFVAFSQSGQAQLNLKNKTECSFLVKLNLVEEGDCKPDGTGGLIVLEGEEEMTLPPLSNDAWVICYGVEEIEESPSIIMVGKSACGFNTEIKDFGSCEATVKYTDSGLIIE